MKKPISEMTEEKYLAYVYELNFWSVIGLLCSAFWFYILIIDNNPNNALFIGLFWVPTFYFVMPFACYRFCVNWGKIITKHKQNKEKLPLKFYTYIIISTLSWGPVVPFIHFLIMHEFKRRKRRNHFKKPRLSHKPLMFKMKSTKQNVETLYNSVIQETIVYPAEKPNDSKE